MLGKIKAKDYFNYLCENFMRLGKEESGRERNHFWLLFFFSVDFGSPDSGIFSILKLLRIILRLEAWCSVSTMS